MRNYEIPGESQPNNTPTHPHSKQALSALLEAHTRLHTAQAAMLDFQLIMAKRAATMCEALEAQLLSETDSARRVALAEQINTTYTGIIGLLFDMAPTIQDTESNEKERGSDQGKT